jgi:hypothetical protein
MSKVALQQNETKKIKKIHSIHAMCVVCESQPKSKGNTSKLVTTELPNKRKYEV